jgi:hypothetical protein
MRLRERERWRCTNRECRSEILVTKTGEIEGQTTPRCCCGGAMKKPYNAPKITKIESPDDMKNMPARMTGGAI